MNDESDKPLSPPGDDALEARIVAWVLGEASSFEAAELEKLCAADPALRRFEQRIRDLHGLIGEDVKAGTDRDWRLPEAKRAKVTDLLGTDIVRLVPAKSADRYFRRRILLAAAACLMISVVAYSTFGTKNQKPEASLALQVSSNAPSDRVEPLRKSDVAKEEAGAVADEGALALNDAASAVRGIQPMTRAAGPAKPASLPSQEQSQILAKAKKSLSGGVGGAGGVAGADSFAGAAPAEADSLASNTELSRGQETFGRNLRGMADDSGNAPMNTDLAAVAEGPAAMPEAESAPADVRLKELADLDQERTASAPVSPAVPAVTPMAPGMAAGKDVESDRTAGQTDPQLGLNFLSSSDTTGAPADFFDLRRMGEVEEGLKVAPQPGMRLGGYLSYDSAEPPTSPFSMDSEALDRLARNAPGMDAPSDAPIPPTGGTAFESRETPSVTPIPAEQPVGEVTRSLEGTEELRKRGKYGEIRQIADAALAADPNNAEAKRLKESLGDPIATNPELSYQTEEQKDKTRRSLYTAEGFYNLGKYDEATRAYEDVLRVDPFNKAARRGMERATVAKSDYYRAAYDHTRAELLAQVDEAWETSVPPMKEGSKELKEKALKAESGAYSGLAQEEMIRRQNAVVFSDKIRDEGRQAYADGNYQLAVDKYKEALQELPDAPVVKDRRDYLGLLLADGASALGEQYAKTGDKAKTRELALGILAVDPGNAVAKALLLEEKPKPEEKSDETSATAQPFSTFSLHVSDASFKLAKAALERGELPDPASIRPEEFYNAFDYGDPAPGRGEPVACLLEQCANPITPQRNLVRIAVRAGSAGRGQSTPLNLTLLLDSSGSMEREDRHQGMTMAVRQLAGLLKEGDSVSVIGFSRQPRLLVDRLPGARAKELNVLLAQTPSEGGTNLEEGLKLAEELAKRQFNAAAQNRIVLFTDGAANLGDAEPETLQAKIEAMRQDGIAFDAAGFGTDGLNDKLLERLTRNGNGRYYIVDRPEDADANFAKQLAGAFRPAAENVKVQVRFNPARVGKYKLIGFEEHRLNKEDFRNDAVDAAEMAAEEAGNALYQIEPLPGGEGEIGEVSVRFRDAASGQMVERTWAIPYEAQAPAFDLASPSIQLAGLSAFAAEKLRQTPTAASIDFQQLGPIFAKVKARYPNSQAVSDLGAMIGKLK
ncbi:YfbK domain-containing protein [Luteolibacter luteus]|uniref:DUF3520 domain-containing protein n=1 Tax=Luteolibacter luteus TaxID=2728835 RepID=A0A858RQ50_9BACT|nr:von Willebrand factor type A domain-containing protein [Luteolibacter luteus]QJE98053.1 DUF3520 domain-containing protein [Luteolibacter luteus]